MSMEYIRDAYGVPAKRGCRVRFTGGDAGTMGTITGARGHYLRIRLDGHKRSMSYHPTWEIEYMTPNVQVQRDSGSIIAGGSAGTTGSASLTTEND